jgi:hypothetical protein
MNIVWMLITASNPQYSQLEYVTQVLIPQEAGA